MRKFEKVSFDQFLKDGLDWAGDETELRKIYDNIKLPKRGTSKSAGYDFFSPFGFDLYPNGTCKIPTGIKVHMNEFENLDIYVRSSTGFKFNVNLLNSTGIIDFDYVNNPTNEGHIWMGFKNFGDKHWVVNSGDAFAQGIFRSFLTTDDDNANEQRTGGIGSTTK